MERAGRGPRDLTINRRSKEIKEIKQSQIKSNKVKQMGNHGKSNANEKQRLKINTEQARAEISAAWSSLSLQHRLSSSQGYPIGLTRALNTKSSPSSAPPPLPLPCHVVESDALNTKWLALFLPRFFTLCRQQSRKSNGDRSDVPS